MGIERYFEQLEWLNRSHVSEEEEDEEGEDHYTEDEAEEGRAGSDDEGREEAVRKREKRRLDRRVQRRERGVLLRRRTGRWFVEAVDAEGRSALHHAALYGHDKCVAMLLSFGAADAALEVHDASEGMTALMQV
jgi:hypothetical protein